jgi:hypothetical protein
MVPLTVQSDGRLYVFQARLANETDMSPANEMRKRELTISHDQADVVPNLPVAECFLSCPLDDTLPILVIRITDFSRIVIVLEVVSNKPFAL